MGQQCLPLIQQFLDILWNKKHCPGCKHTQPTFISDMYKTWQLFVYKQSWPHAPGSTWVSWCVRLFFFFFFICNFCSFFFKFLKSVQSNLKQVSHFWLVNYLLVCLPCCQIKDRERDKMKFATRFHTKLGAQLCFSASPSWKHAYIILTPLNPTFI